MERLTKITKLKGDTHDPYYTLAKPYDEERDNYWAIQKLAAYENMGLEPSEIAELRTDFVKCKRMYDDLDGLLAMVADERDKLKHSVAVLEKALENYIIENGDYDCNKDWDVVCIDALEGSENCAKCELSTLKAVVAYKCKEAEAELKLCAYYSEKEKDCIHSSNCFGWCNSEENQISCANYKARKSNGKG